MIVIDFREETEELLKYFKPYDVEVRVRRLEFADFMFWGEGPDGPVKIGVERKALGDLVASMRSNRLSGFQLPGLLKNYTWIYLLIEGIYRSGEGGIVEIQSGRGRNSVWTPIRVGSKPILYREVDHYLATLEHRCGLSAVFMKDKEQIVAWMVSRYKWWEKEWDKHDSFEAVYAPYEHIIPARRGSLVLKHVGPVEMVAAQLPGISKKAFEVGKRFKTVEQLVKADIRELQEVEGIGKKGAVAIHNWLRGG